MIFSLDVRRARKGDCLLLHFGSEDDPGLIMIDGGPRSVYSPHLKPRLLEIKEARGLDKNEPLPVDLLMVSHVDDDHIRGILDLTKEMIDNPHAPLVQIASFWHNSFDDIIGNDPAELTASFTAQFGAAATTGELPAEAELETDEPDTVVRDNLKVLASIAQGHRLRGDILKLGAELNAELGDELILCSSDPVPLGRDLSFTVAGPMKAELQELQDKHDKWLHDQKDKEAEAALAAYVDRSVPNLSSIVVHATCDGKSMLLTGDARGDKILEGLEEVGLLQPGETMEVDVLKVPHHGSANNLETGFFERILASHYVFSGDGEHGNPERETLEMLFAARGDDPFTIHLTYPIDEIDVERKNEWEKQQAREKARAAKGGKRKPRDDWSPQKHSLAAFLDQAKLASGQKIEVVAENEPHVIDLLDDLGY